MSIRNLLVFLFVLTSGCQPAVAAKAVDKHAGASAYASRADVRAFVREMVVEQGFDARQLDAMFAQVNFLPKVVAAMSRPMVTPPKWYEYAPQFLSAARIGGGVEFWRQHQAVLARAEQEYGVPAEVMVAIIGVETFYGRNTGSFRIIDALSTLAFDYPRRAEYFRGELKAFLVSSREAHVSPLAPKGSFAGAVGLPQFMPSSVRDYAVDYDSDGVIDLAGDVDDAIGSVGHYLARHDWQSGQPVMTEARISSDSSPAVLRALDGGISERRAVIAWIRDGVTGFAIPGDMTPDPVGLLMLEQSDGPRYWVVFNNWFVLTRYNRSRLYASAVWELARAIKREVKASTPR